MRKRILALVLATALCLCGCQENTPDPTQISGTQTTFPSQQTTEAPRPQQADGIVLSEVMPDNKLLTLGHERDWVELYNRGEAEVSLEGYWLTDDPTEPEKLSLSGLTLASEGYAVVELGEDAPFRLSSQGETLYLMAQGEQADAITFGLSEEGASYDAAGALPWPTPGFANTQDGYLAYLEQLELPGLILSEVLAANDSYPASDGVCYDYIEVANISGAPIDLSGYTLSDKRSEPDRYRFPAVTLEPGEFYTVYCSDDPRLGQDHAAFKISASGEKVYLSKDGVITDALSVPGDLGRDESFGRDGKVPSYLLYPTPGQANSKGFLSGVELPTASLPSGIYPDPITVTLSGEGTIYYTLDGSRPTEDSNIYTQPLEITGVTTVRTFCVSGERTGAVAAYTYLIGVEHDLPVVCVAIPEESLTGSRGVLNHIGMDYEYEAVLTLIEGGEEKFSVPFGFCLHGNDSRKMAKQNFSLRFRSEYGVGKLNYRLFADRDIDEFNSLLLKGGSEDFSRAMMRDEVSTAIAEGTSLYTQATKPVVLYLGGEYWGVYYLRERFSDDYVASHLGVSADSVDLLRSSGAFAQSGTEDAYYAIWDYVSTHDMSKPENYAWLEQRIDVESLMDWYICRAYGADSDYGNIRRFHSEEGDGKWRWMFFDLDWSMLYPYGQPFTKLLTSNKGEPLLMNCVLRSEEGRDLFLKRCAMRMETTFAEERILGIIDGLVEQIASEMPADRARWGYPLENWEQEVQKLRDFASDGKRIEQMKKDLKDWFSLTDAEMEYYFG